MLKNSAGLRYFYMDTKKNPEGGEQKAKEAYALYPKFHPDGVITVDDNAQWMFVIPYLKDKVKTPVMFCGVNASPEKYGYPASNVSGILERYHIAESIALAKLLVPSIHTFGFISKDSPTAELLLTQIRSESDTCPAKFITARMPRTLDETVSMSEELRAQCDLLLLGALEGLPDKGGKPTTEKKSIPIVAKTFGKHLLALINDVLDMSKIEAGRTLLKKKSFALHRTLTVIEEMIRSRAGARGLQFIVNRTTDVPRYIRADAQKLRQVLLNLLGNAVKFTTQGGIALRVSSKQWAVSTTKEKTNSLLLTSYFISRSKILVSALPRMRWREFLVHLCGNKAIRRQAKAPD